MRPQGFAILPNTNLFNCPDGVCKTNHSKYYRDHFPNTLLLAVFLIQPGQNGKKTEIWNIRKTIRQKALAGADASAWVLSLPEQYEVEMIPSGCCGMAGSFGYEKEHYEVSMNVGELVLFPALRQAASEAIVAAPGTSCRHQILDGTGRERAKSRVDW